MARKRQVNISVDALVHSIVIDDEVALVLGKRAMLRGCTGASGQSFG